MRAGRPPGATVPATGRGREHRVLAIAPGLLLVFKPRGHREDEHAHPHRQRLLVLRGRVAVRTRRRALILRAGASLDLPAGRRHATEALADTWLVAEARVRRERRRAGDDRSIAVRRRTPRGVRAVARRGGA